MTMLRSIATLLLILTLLPWGAYASQSKFQQTAVSKLSDAEPSLVVVDSDAGQTPVFVSANTKRCRAAGLIGSSCGPDIAIPRSTISFDPFVTTNAVTRADEPRLIGTTPSTALDPPRFC